MSIVPEWFKSPKSYQSWQTDWNNFSDFTQHKLPNHYANIKNRKNKGIARKWKIPELPPITE